MGADRSQTITPVTPSAVEALLAQETSRRLEDVVDDETVHRFQLIRDDEPGEVFAIPAVAMQLLVQMLAEMGQGHAVALTPVQSEVTTQQAADMLNVSRPYLVNLLEDGKIPFRKVGTRRRILLRDVMSYKRASDAKRYETLNELTAYDQELGLQ